MPNPLDDTFGDCFSTATLALTTPRNGHILGSVVRDAVDAGLFRVPAHKEQADALTDLRVYRFDCTAQPGGDLQWPGALDLALLRLPITVTSPTWSPYLLPFHPYPVLNVLFVRRGALSVMDVVRNTGILNVTMAQIRQYHPVLFFCFTW